MKAAIEKSVAQEDYALAEGAAQFIRGKIKIRPRIAVVLGSGLGSFAEQLAERAVVPYAEIPNFPRPTAEGHAGNLVMGKLEAVPLVVMQGRVHLYEGYSGREVVFPVRVMARLGAKAVVLTNAAGGINTDYQQGCLVVLKDHINLQGTNPLAGSNDERLGPRFPDMTHAYFGPYRKLALEQGRRLGIAMHEGVYAAVLGPSYETPAEIRYLRTIGADLVGMSTVAEVIAARHLGLRVLAISCVTNMAAGILDQPLNHEEVLQTGERVKTKFLALLEAVLPQVEDLAG